MESKNDSILGPCVKCGVLPANSSTDNLCFGCHKQKEGYEFNEEQKRYIKKEEKHGKISRHERSNR